jgi:hypothetical protein
MLLLPMRKWDPVAEIGNGNWRWRGRERQNCWRPSGPAPAWHMFTAPGSTRNFCSSHRNFTLLGARGATTRAAAERAAEKAAHAATVTAACVAARAAYLDQPVGSPGGRRMTRAAGAEAAAEAAGIKADKAGKKRIKARLKAAATARAAAETAALEAGPVIELNGAALATPASAKYLGSVYSTDGTLDNEITARLAAAQGATLRLRHSVWHQRRLGATIKLRLYRSLVLTVLLYGGESWPITQENLHRLEVFHQRRLREILLVKWTDPACEVDGVTNEEVLRRAGMPSIEVMLLKARLSWLGHIARMGEERTVKRLLFGQMTEGRQAAGDAAAHIPGRRARPPGWRAQRHGVVRSGAGPRALARAGGQHDLGTRRRGGGGGGPRRRLRRRQRRLKDTRTTIKKNYAYNLPRDLHSTFFRGFARQQGALVARAPPWRLLRAAASAASLERRRQFHCHGCASC